MRFLIPIAMAGSMFALEDPSTRVATIQSDAEAKLAAYARDWLGRARLTPLALPAVNLTDCKPSEAKALDDARLINDRLKEARRLLAAKDCSDKDLANFFNLATIRDVQAAQGKPIEAVATAPRKPPAGGVSKSHPAE